jgi:hypothetical protein
MVDGVILENFKITDVANSFFARKVIEDTILVKGKKLLWDNNLFVAARCTKYLSTASTMVFSVYHGKCAFTIFTMSAGRVID